MSVEWNTRGVLSAIWVGVVLCAASAAAQTGTVPLDNGTPPSGLTNSNIAVSNGNVGIGTTSPGNPLNLQVAGSGSPLGAMSIDVDSFGSASNAAASYFLRGRDLGGGITPFSISGNGSMTTGGTFTWSLASDPSDYFSTASLIPNGTGNANLTYLQFQVHGWPGTTVMPMVLTGAGNVGIGTTSPGSKLEVDGNLSLTSGSGASLTFADGTVQSTAFTGVLCGGDYAESVDIDGDRADVEPGDVLVLDEHNQDKVLKSAEPYSTMVAGIFSTRPGVVGRRQRTPKSSQEVPMAMIGIVPTKVSTENGPIKVGDLLVSSSRPGYAMRGTDRSRMLGAVIGKSMGTLASGTGTVEVLVTLQ